MINKNAIKERKDDEIKAFIILELTIFQNKGKKENNNYITKKRNNFIKLYKKVKKIII